MGVNVSHDAENVDDVFTDSENETPKISKLEKSHEDNKERERIRAPSSNSLRAFEDEGDEGEEKKLKKKTFSLLSLKKQKEDPVQVLNGDVSDDEEKEKGSSIWRRKSKTSESDTKGFKSGKDEKDSDEEKEKGSSI